MLISCEKCATTYVLDDGLIPPSGAPVQCTKCGHVFTARVPGPPAARTGLGEETIPARSGSAQTMMFGAGGLPVPAPSPQRPPSAGGQTLVFGAAVSPASPLTARPQGPGARPAAASPPSNPPQPANQTIAFGAVAPRNPVALPQQRGAPASGGQTMIFGGGQVGPSDSTLPFRQEPPQEAPAPASTRRSGGFAPAPEAPPPASTRRSGGFAPAPLVGQNAAGSTRSSGGFAPVPSPGPRVNATVVFGTSARTTDPETPAHTPEPPAAEPPSPQRQVRLSERTVRVDLETMLRERDAPREESRERNNRTQIFAMSTQPEPERTPSDGSDSVEVRHNRTQLFAMNAQQETTKPDSHAPKAEDRTHPGSNPILAALAQPLPPNLPPPPGSVIADGSSTLPPDVPLRQTIVYGGARPGPITQPVDRPVELSERAAADAGMATPPSAPSATVPQLAAVGPEHRVDVPATLDLPAEPPALLVSTSADTDRFAQEVRVGRGGTAQFEAVMVETKHQSRRRARLAIAFLLLVVLGLAGAIAWKVLGPRLFQQVPPEAVGAVGDALGQLRLDDGASKAQAIASLDRLVTQHPSYVEAHAARVLALALRYDDLEQRLKRLDAQRTSLEGQRRVAAEAKQADLDGRINDVVRQFNDGKGPAEEAYRQLQDALKAMGTAVAATELDANAAVAFKRAKLMVDAVTGRDGTVEAVERFSRTTEGRDAWGALLLPEYYLNVTTDPDTRRAQLAGLEALTASDSGSTFVRPYVLIARLKLLTGDPAGAERALATVLNFRANHEIAAELMAWAKERLELAGP